MCLTVIQPEETFATLVTLCSELIVLHSLVHHHVLFVICEGILNFVAFWTGESLLPC